MRYKILLAFLLFLSLSSNAYASKLPDSMWNYIQKELPKATQRFDSVIVLNENLMYVPLYPAQRDDREDIKLEYTYPQNKSLKALPEVAIFNNNFVLMKVYRDKTGNFTITKNENLPEKVKLGVMPQDMLVPTGLKVPESLKIIMGNLLIPNKGDNLLITTSDAVLGTSFDDEAGEADIVPINELKNTKAFFANNKNKFVLVYDKGGTKPLYEIKLSGLPSKILAAPVSKFALTMYFGSKSAEIVDLVNERVLTKIEFENIPSDADIDLATQIAYVTSSRANAIYVVDLNSATLAKTVKMDRSPDKIAVSSQDKMLVFNDKTNENIYIMDLFSGDYSIKKIANVPNLSKLLIGNGKIMAVSRTQNKAYMYSINSFEAETPVTLTRELNLAEKPTDAILYNNKAFILCSKDGVINVYDFEQNKMLEPIALDTTGFYSKITVVPEKNNAIVTGLNTKKIILINLDTAKLEKKASSDIDVADVVIIDDKPQVKPIEEKQADDTIDEAI